ncbi:cytochrome P450 [Streptomyces griseoviridis]|uniref:cytochrome P450 n=1 Tax=Streptomyces griseoviridis TaxID=45398 RepID=UPI003448630C
MTEDPALLTTTTAPPVREWPALDLDGADFDPVLAELMREGPLTRIRLPHGEGWAWLATRYDDVRAVTNDPRFGRAEVTRRQVTRMAPHFKPRPGSLAFADQPDHNRLRKAVAGAFTVAAMKRLRPRAQRLLDDLVDGVVRDGPPADLIERVLEPFPLAVVSEVMGVPAEDRERVHSWTREIISTTGAEAAGRAKEGLYGWIAEAIRARAGGTGEDVYALLGAAVGRGEISEEEAVGLAGPLQIGGEAVTHNCGQMLFLMLTDPELLRATRALGPGARGPVLDELLRYIPHRSSVGLARIALEDVEVAGHRIAAGEPVYVSYLAANRDPEVFPDPDRVDVERAPNPHLAFGNGPHYCTGAVLARTQTELLVDTLLDRLPGLRLAVPADQVAWRRRTMIRGPRNLPVTW